MHTQHARPLWRGMIHAGVVAPLALAGMLMTTVSDASVTVFLQLLAVAVPVTTLAVLLFGVTGALVLRRLGLLHWTTLCLGGGLAGLAIAALVSDLLVSDYTPRAWTWWLLGALAGLASGIAFASGIRPHRVWGRCLSTVASDRRIAPPVSTAETPAS